MSTTLESLRPLLQRHGQEHLLRFAAQLDSAQQAVLRDQLSATEWDALAGWVRDYVLQAPRFEIPADLAPAEFYPLQPRDAAEADLYRRAVATGWDLLRQGQVAAFTVAGGQGTRLGYEGPKGTFPIGPLSGKTLFQWFAESLHRWGERAGRPIPWYIMTSPMNDAATRQFFATHHHFGLAADQVTFFPQGTLPAFDYQGRLLLADPGQLALAPDGHGGSLKAMARSGALADMARRGIRHISYFQVDNPLVSVVNPYFLGLHELTGAEMSNRSLPKSEPFEKVGAFCRSGGRLMVVEYSDLPRELAVATDAQGRLRYLAGSPAIHILARSFVERLNAGGAFSLPLHRAEKKIPYVDDQGHIVTPAKPNGIKLEAFVFDALPLAERAIVVEAWRDDEFGPVKNATGVDSVASSQRLLQERFARWLQARGIALPRDGAGALACSVEISPRHWVTADDGQQLSLANLKVAPGAAVSLP